MPAVRRALVSIAVGYDFAEMFTEAFRACGWTARTAIFHQHGSQKGWKNYLNRPISMLRGAEATFQREKERCLTEIYAKVSADQPDLLLAIRGEWLDRAAVEKVRALRPGIKVVIWMYDSLIRYQQVLEAASVADRFYLYDGDDVASYRRTTGLGASRFDLGYSAERFHPLGGSPRTTDACLTGSFGLRSFDKRAKAGVALSRLAEKHGLSLELVGPCWTDWSPTGVAKRRAMRNRFPGFLERFQNKKLPYPRQNELYNRTKVVINVHNDDSTGSCNTRVFEIMGAGAFQLCDYNPVVAEHFREGEHLAMFRDDRELEEKLLYYLSHGAERDRIARAGFKRVEAAHQLRHRVERLIAEAFNETAGVRT